MKVTLVLITSFLFVRCANKPLVQQSQYDGSTNITQEIEYLESTNKLITGRHFINAGLGFEWQSTNPDSMIFKVSTKGTTSPPIVAVSFNIDGKEYVATNENAASGTSYSGGYGTEISIRYFRIDCDFVKKTFLKSNKIWFRIYTDSSYIEYTTAFILENGKPTSVYNGLVDFMNTVESYKQGNK